MNSQLDKLLDVFQSVVRLESASLPEIQADCGQPMSTTHRIMQTLIRRGFVLSARKGHYQLGMAAIAIGRAASEHDLLRSAARTPIRQLSRQVRAHVHLGILDDFMVTYLVKQSYGKKRIHSVEGTQLEPYCSALGKVLLASLAPEVIARYINDGPFVALTDRTITDPAALHDEIARVRQSGWAIDDGGIADGLRCIAVPVHAGQDRVVGAISISTLMAGGEPVALESFLEPLQATAGAVSRKIQPSAVTAVADSRISHV